MSSEVQPEEHSGDPNHEIPPKEGKSKAFKITMISLAIASAIAAVVAIFLWITANLFGFVLLAAFSGAPDSSSERTSGDRHQGINQVLEDIGYRESGEIIEESYSGNSSALSPGYFTATIQGAEAFNTLSANILESSTTDCVETGTAVLCDKGMPSVVIESKGENQVLLTIVNNGNN